MLRSRKMPIGRKRVRTKNYRIGSAKENIEESEVKQRKMAERRERMGEIAAGLKPESHEG